MYRIGPSDTFSNADLKADAATLNGQIDTLDNQDMTTVTQAWFDAWFDFRGEWKRFYSNTILGSFFGPAWNDSNRDQLIQFEDRFGTFAQQYKNQTGGELPGGVVDPSTGAGDTLGAHLKKQLEAPLVILDSYKWWIVAAVGVATLITFREPIKALLRGVK